MFVQFLNFSWSFHGFLLLFFDSNVVVFVIVVVNVVVVTVVVVVVVVVVVFVIVVVVVVVFLIVVFVDVIVVTFVVVLFVHFTVPIFFFSTKTQLKYTKVFLFEISKRYFLLQKRNHICVFK